MALNTAIDEFGSYVKEHFIAINEFDPEKVSTKAANGKVIEAKDEPETDERRQQQQQQQQADEKKTTESVTTTSEEEAEALKLKEALEVARQNFYKGKVSLVCLSKHGEGYVVKEMQNQTEQNAASAAAAVVGDLVVNHSPDTSLSNSDGLINAGPKINVEDVDTTTTKSGKFFYQLLFYETVKICSF